MTVKERIPDEQVERAKAADLLALAGRHTELRKIARAEYAGPCPKCGGTDRFHVHAENGWWFCRQCHEKRGDAIEFVRWTGAAHTFGEAVAYLTNAHPAPARIARRPAPKPKARAWTAKTWQASAWRELSRAITAMDTKGLGLDYLAGRGITHETARKWLIGALPDVWHPGRREKLPALVMPWIDRRLRITALQYRFIAPVEKRDRFAQKAGGERIIFGATQRRAHPDTAAALMLVEGELNALSIAQAMPAVDVLSYGPQGNAKRPELATIAGRYPRVIIWADEGGRALAASKAIPAAVAMQSPDGLDANDLLQAGELRTFLVTVFKRLDWTVRV